MISYAHFWPLHQVPKCSKSFMAFQLPTLQLCCCAGPCCQWRFHRCTRPAQRRPGFPKASVPWSAPDAWRFSRNVVPAGLQTGYHQWLSAANGYINGWLSMVYILYIYISMVTLCYTINGCITVYWWVKDINAGDYCRFEDGEVHAQA